jgi:hypothetical protein
MIDTNKVTYEKQNESDQQMLLRIGKKFAVLFILLLMFDLVIDLLSGLIDMLIDLFHLILDAIEYSIELILEYFFNSNHQESDVIIVNFAIILALIGIYRLCLFIPLIYARLKKRIKTSCSNRKQKEIECWQSLSLNRKIKVALTYIVGISAILFMLTL